MVQFTVIITCHACQEGLSSVLTTVFNDTASLSIHPFTCRGVYSCIIRDSHKRGQSIVRHCRKEYDKTLEIRIDCKCTFREVRGSGPACQVSGGKAGFAQEGYTLWYYNVHELATCNQLLRTIS